MRRMTDRRGRFVFTGLAPANDYELTAGKAGYLDGAYGRRPFRTTETSLINLESGQWLQTADIALARLGSIAGTVVDERGEPVAGVYVRVLAQVRAAGRHHLAAGPVVLTDDRGRYRMPFLPPGRYVVSVPSVQSSMLAGAPLGRGGAGPGAALPVTLAAGDPAIRLVSSRVPVPPPPRDGRRWTYPPAFHPATAFGERSDAIELGEGEDRAGADIQLEPVRAVRLTGRVEGPPESLTNLVLRLVPAPLEHLGSGSEVATAPVAADGTFTFHHVPVGAYALVARPSLSELTYGTGSTVLPRAPGFGPGGGFSSNSIDSGGPMLGFTNQVITAKSGAFAGRADVSIPGSDTTGVVVPMRPLATLSGRIIWEGERPAGAFSMLRLEPADGDARLGSPQTPPNSTDETGRFLISGLFPGRYVIRPIGSGMIKSILWNGSDYTDRPIEASTSASIDDVVVTFAREPAKLAGTVTRGPSSASAATGVIVFPTDPSLWTGYGFRPVRLRGMLARTTGAFELALPAGDYFVAAVGEDQVSAWQDPEFLRRAAAVATRVSLDWGRTTTSTLRVVEVR
jgi:hypothetical protein